ncbi:rhodanese-like domain-containing protein [Nocardioides sp.]|uniref:rhodanese-like domain-containing protein n=1 Tax=Nocardioides sp. TaxID=35761 RepID=UPI00262A37E6|nr:rhodanese-like domain-containing protein [Nocardioides sp.]
MREVTVEDAAGLIESGAAAIDVREPEEYAAGHVPGAVNIPMGQLHRRLGELDRSRRQVVVCRSGNRSDAMTDVLLAHGFEASNMLGGTVAWARAGRPIETPEVEELTVRVVETPSLGDRSYLVHDGRVAFVVDPQRDIDRVLEVLEADGVRLTHVFETHIHNDYVTGGLALAEATGAAYHVNAEDQVSFHRVPIRDGDVLSVGDRMRVRVIATPGHTFTHLSYALEDHGAAWHRAVGVFTGGSLLYGATGRPDLLGPDHTDALVRHQHASAHRLASELPDEAEVFPTHGFGSFCSATQSDSTSSTIGQEKQQNPVLTQDEETYVRELLAGLAAYPAYYAHMGPANSAGPGAPDLSTPEHADAAELRRRIEAGEWVVDLRHRTAFAAGHAPGTLNFGLDGAFSTYLGWMIEWGTAVTLLGETAEQVAEAQRELVRIGIERPAAQSTGGPEDWSDRPLGRFATATFADLAAVRHHREVVVLDVRRADEHEKTWIEGAVNIPIHDLPRRLDEVPAGEVWVHCAGGYRASVAASFIAAAGRDLVAIDDSFDHAAEAGLPMVGPEA